VNGLQPTPDVLPRLLPERLRAAGYRTIHIGKAHWGARETDGADPLKMGFEVNVAGHAAGAPGSFLGTDHFKDGARKARGSVAPAEAAPSVWDVPGLARWHGKDVWLDDALAHEACDAIGAAVRDGRPFFLSFCPYGVHAPIMSDARFASKYSGLDPTERAYASMVAAVDDGLGRIVRRCTELGVLDSTVIVFTSDNGGLSAHARGQAPDGSTKHAHNAPLRSGKGAAYEGGLRVPFVVAGPGIAARAVPDATPIVGTDLYPTLLALAGVARAPMQPSDGVDLSAVIRDGAALPSRTILFHQPHKWGPTGPGIEPFSAVRVGEWKLIWFHDDQGSAGRFELFAVGRDPSENSECSASHPERLAEMRGRLRAALDDSGAQLPTRRDGRALAAP
jgi:arylsulfatase A-like enzyme